MTGDLYGGTGAVSSCGEFRRSIRQFQKTMVSDEARDRILETGRYTATAANRQDNRLIWVQKELDELKETLWEELPGVIPLFEKEAPAMAARFSEFSKAHAADGKDSLFLVRRCCWQSRDNRSWMPDWRRQTWR